MAVSHTNTRNALIRDIAIRLTDKRGSFSAIEVHQVCRQQGIICDRSHVDNALNYLTKIDNLKYNGAGWYVWLKK